MLRFKPSTLVAASIYLTNTLQNEAEPWTEQLQHHTQYTIDDLEPCVDEFRSLIADASKEQVYYYVHMFIHTLPYCNCYTVFLQSLLSRFCLFSHTKKVHVRTAVIYFVCVTQKYKAVFKKFCHRQFDTVALLPALLPPGSTANADHSDQSAAAL